MDKAHKEILRSSRLSDLSVVSAFRPNPICPGSNIQQAAVCLLLEKLNLLLQIEKYFFSSCIIFINILYICVCVCVQYKCNIMLVTRNSLSSQFNNYGISLKVPSHFSTSWIRGDGWKDLPSYSSFFTAFSEQ